MVYRYKTGYFNKVSAQVAGEEIHRLWEEGKCNAKDIVDASRPIDAPLHPVFEWDDSIAAELYRQEQARTLVRQIVTVVETEQEQNVHVRAFFKIDPNESTYEPTVTIMSDDDKKKRLLEIAKRELYTFKQKYATIQELSGVFAAIDTFLESDGDRA